MTTNFSVLDTFESAFKDKNVSIVEFAESEEYCNTPDAPIWMADLSFKRLDEVKVGDKVVGWYRKEEYATREMCESVVLNVSYREADLVEVKMESGRSFVCSSDHLWLTGSFSSAKRGEWFGAPKVGRQLVHLIDKPCELIGDKRDKAHWLGGIFDGEGSASRKAGVTIAQSDTHNPLLCSAIEECLTDLGFGFSRSDRAYLLRVAPGIRTAGVNHKSKQMITNFVNWCHPVRRQGLIDKVMTRMSRINDRIISVIPCGRGSVIGLTTSTGNYVAHGYASKNCGKALYPRQRVLLKLIWLEEMDGYEEDVLSEWIRGDDPDILMCSKVRERRDQLREEGYKHFREIMLIGGRRSSKGHITGISIAKKLFDMVSLENPQKHYGIDPDKQIYATIIAAALDQAKQYQYADAIGAVSSCKALEPYFNKFLEEIFSLYTPADLDRAARFAATAAKVERDFASLICKPRAANAGTIRGEATAIAVIDEMAHMLEGVNSKSSAEKIYKAVTPALDQFRKDGIIFENSSPYTKIGQFYENYKIGMPLTEDERVDKDRIVDHRMLCFQFPSWALYKDWEKDSRFQFAFSLPPELDPAMALEEEKDPETFRVERRSHFAEVVDSFLNPVKVDEIFRPWNERELLTKYDRAPHGPEVEFAGHADPATTTANFGLAIGHREEGFDRDGNSVPHVVFDYIHAWRPGDYEDHTINYVDLQDEIVDLIDAFRPNSFSFDQFQSRGLIDYIRREIRKKRMGEVKVKEKVATVRVNYQRAHVFKTAINLNLVHAPLDSSASELAKNELKFLQERNGRVDRQTTGPVITKDVADCMMEVVNTLIGNHLAFIDPNMHMVTGAQGGFGAEAPLSRLGEGLQHPSEFYNRGEKMRALGRRLGGSPTRGISRGRRRMG